MAGFKVATEDFCDCGPIKVVPQSATGDEPPCQVKDARRIEGQEAVVRIHQVVRSLRRGELVALQWGDIQFGASEEDQNRFVLVEHNYVDR